MVEKNKKIEQKGKGVKKQRMESVDDVVGYQLENSSGINCYGNVILNVVFYLQDLYEEIMENHEKRLCSALYHLFQELTSDRSKMHTASGVRQLLDTCTGSLTFSINIQQDAQEFLMVMLGVLEDEGIQIESLFGLSYK